VERADFVLQAGHAPPGVLAAHQGDDGQDGRHQGHPDRTEDEDGFHVPLLANPEWTLRPLVVDVSDPCDSAESV
jgi:hypothetical protein